MLLLLLSLEKVLISSLFFAAGSDMMLYNPKSLVVLKNQFVFDQRPLILKLKKRLLPPLFL
jgi:hypothetical protein